jgi:hypothetical protein
MRKSGIFCKVEEAGAGQAGTELYGDKMKVIEDMQNISNVITKPLDEGPGTETVWEVPRYRAGWELDAHRGLITFYDPFYRIIASRFITSPAEFSAVVDLLRNEKPMYYNTSSGMIYTKGGEFGEVVGEEES